MPRTASSERDPETLRGSPRDRPLSREVRRITLPADRSHNEARMHSKPPHPKFLATPPVAALMLSLVALLPVARDVSATPSWFSPQQPRLTWYFDRAAIASDTRRGRALAFGGTLYSSGHGGISYQSDTDSTFAFGFAPTLGMFGLPLTGAAPAPRSHAAFAYDSLADRAWLFGGRALRVDSSQLQPLYFPVPLADLWALDASASPASWQQVTPLGIGPARRFGHTMVSDPAHRRLIVYGGRDSLGACFADLSQLDLTADPPQWSVIAPAGAAPAARWSHAAAFDPISQRMYVHSGSSASGGLTSTWALDLSGAPRWDSLAVAPPSVAITALAWDSRRGRLLGYGPNPGTLFVLDSTGGTPAWVAQPAAPIVRGVRPQVSGGVGAAYDAVHDQLLVPYAGFLGQTFVPSMASPWAIAIDPALSPGAPANLSPQKLSLDAWHGLVYMRWSLFSSGGLLYELPGLEREIGAGVFNPVGQPFAWDPDSAIAQWRYPDQPLQWTRWQVRWFDPVASHTVTSWYDWTAPGPIAMTCTVDSAQVVGGAMRLQWTLANDSLSRLVAPHVYRRTGITTTDLGVAWPDSSRRVRAVDPGIVGGNSYTWWIGWSAHAGADTCGAVSIGVTNATPIRVDRQQPGLGTYLRWSVTGTAPFTATAYRRASDTGAWTAFDTLDADANRDVVLRERGLPLASHVEYRLGWRDAGVEAFTAREVFDVPPFTADVESTFVGTRRVRVVWSVWPYDTLLAVRTVAVHDHAFVIERPAVAGAPRVSVTDSTGAPGSVIGFSVVARLSDVDHPAGATELALALPPALIAADRSGGHVILGWSGSPAADAYGIWRSLDGGPFVRLSEPQTGVDLIGLYETEPAGADSATYELRWHEWDGVWRATRDTTLHFTTPPGPVTVAEFELSGAQPSASGPTFRFALPDARPATVAFLDLSGRELARTTATGTGTLLAPASLRAGVYWVRFTHPTRTLTRKIVVLR